MRECSLVYLDSEQTRQKMTGWLIIQMDYLDADSLDGHQEGIEWMKAGDLHELLFLLVRYARLDSLQQGMGLRRRGSLKQHVKLEVRGQEEFHTWSPAFYSASKDLKEHKPQKPWFTISE